MASISPFAEISIRNEALVVQNIIYLKMAVIYEFNLIFFLSHVGDLCHDNCETICVGGVTWLLYT